MKALRMIAGAAALLTLGAAALPAQDSLPPRRPQARMRMHAPGTGLQPGVTPMQRRLGVGRSAAGVGQGLGGLCCAPRNLLGQRDFLGLTDEQVDQLETLDQGMQAARDKAMEDVRARQEELQTLWQADRPDASAIRRSFEAVMKAEQEAQLTAVEATARAKGMLTAEQLGKVQGLAQGRLRGARGPMGMRGGRAMPGGGRAMPGAGKGRGGMMMPRGGMGRGGMRTPRPPIRNP